MRTFSQRTVDSLIALRWPLLGLAVVLAAFAYFPARNLDFDRSIENMFADDDPLLPPYRKLKEKFGGNEIVMVVYVDPRLLDEDGSGIKDLETISGRLKKIDGVRGVLSLSEISRVLDKIRSMDPFKPPPTLPSIIDPNSFLGKNYRQLFEGYTHGADGETVAVVCMLEPENEAAVPRRVTIDALRAESERLNEGRIVGEPVMVVDGFAYIEEDGRRLGIATTILLAVTIILCFRSLRWVLIPVAVVQFTLLITKAVLVWSRLPLSMVSSMLTAIVTVVGIATVVHIIVRFREARSTGLSPRDSLARAGALLIVPVFWACVTDAVGFSSLLFAQVGPVQDFGLMMAIGSLLVLVSVALLLPGMALLGSFDTDPQRAWGERFLDVQLGRLVGWVEKAPAAVGAVAVIVVAAAVTGTAWLDVETDFTKNFVDDPRDERDIVSSYQFVESNLGGAGVWDVILPAPHYLDAGYLSRVRRLEGRLRAIRFENARSETGEPALTKVISVADADEATKVGPILSALGPSMRLKRMSEEIPTFFDAMLSAIESKNAPRHLRIMLRAKERQPAAQKLWLIDEVRRVIDDELAQPDWQPFFASLLPPPPDDAKPPAEVTGFFVLLTNLIKSMVRDQWICFGVASAGIALMMLIAFRSVVLALVALVPNVLPILMVLGLMGWLGLVFENVKINMGAAMIAAVSIGLSVDSSIHYITSFRRARKAGKSVRDALAEVQQTVGRAMVFSTLALIVGFTVLCWSSFVPTIYFGVLVSLAMLGGLFGNLLVLPLLLQLVSRDWIETTRDKAK